MKRSYDFVTELDLGMLGVRTVDVSYSYDPSIHCLNLMAVYLKGYDGSLGTEITDYLSGRAEDLLYDEMSRDCVQQRQEEADYAAECAADAEREEQMMRGAA